MFADCSMFALETCDAHAVSCTNCTKEIIFQPPHCNRFYDNISNCASLNSLSSVASIVLFSVLRGVEVTFFCISVLCVTKMLFTTDSECCIFIVSLRTRVQKYSHVKECKYTALSKVCLDPCIKYGFLMFAETGNKREKRAN